MVDTVLVYHYPCVDGVAAATIAFKAVLEAERAPELMPMQYGHEEKLNFENFKNKRIIFVDFSFKYPTMERLTQYTDEKILVLDHHKTAMEELAPLAKNPQFEIIFDMNKCGAILAWEYFFSDQYNGTPELLRYIDDYDRWQWRYGVYTDYVHEFLLTKKLVLVEFENMIFHQSPKELMEYIIDVGSSLVEAKNNQVNELINNCAGEVFDTATNKYIAIVNCPGFLASKVGNRLSENCPYAICWYYNEQEKKYIFSLRSNKNFLKWFDVSLIAKSHGGGGHANAAGFSSSTWPERFVTAEVT